MNDKNITKLISQVDATNESWGRFKENRSRTWGLFGHDMGIHPFNLMLGGWIPKKVTTIGGRSGMGKSALTVPIFKGGARVLNNRRAEFLFFTWEMGPSYMVDRHISSEVGITLRMLNQGAKLLEETLYSRVQEAYKSARRLPVTYQEFSTNIDTVKAIGYEFVETCKKKSEIEGVHIQPVIVIDFVGMAQFEGDGLRTYGIAGFMNGIKQFCNVTGASALILAQINRTADNKAAPDRSDFSDSQSIETASDNLVIIHRPEYNGIKTMFDPVMEQEIPSDNKMLVRVLKGRDYGTGDFVIESDVKHFRFHDVNHSWDFPYWELYSDEEFWLKHFGLKKMTEQLTSLMNIKVYQNFKGKDEELTFKVTIYPDGQKSVTFGEEILRSPKFEIKARLINFSDLELLYCVVGAIRRAHKYANIGLNLVYCFGLRSDRQFQFGSENYVEDVVSLLLTKLNFQRVRILDPHSDVILGAVGATPYFITVNEARNANNIVFPDSGALFKYRSLFSDHIPRNFMWCEKERSTDGTITKLRLRGQPPTKSAEPVYVFDDLCDGGATFIKLAEELLVPLGFNNLKLVVTHGLFSKGFNNLLNWYKRY